MKKQYCSGTKMPCPPQFITPVVPSACVFNVIFSHGIFGSSMSASHASEHSAFSALDMEKSCSFTCFQ